ncbi:MAG: histidine phosphatase family protein [Candidatus Saccharimonadales bacterium]
MNTFYIVRHGETENNVAGRLSGWIDTPLTKKGLEPTQKVLEKLAHTHIDDIYTSDLGRAFITAYFIARGLRLTHIIKPLAGLREVNYGDAANMNSAKAYTLYAGLDSNTHYTPPNGEALDHMQQRVLQTVNSLDAQHTDQNLLVVAHSGVMGALRASYLKTDFGEHNISEAYPHDYVGIFTLVKGEVASFEEFKG